MDMVKGLLAQNHKNLDADSCIVSKSQLDSVSYLFVNYQILLEEFNIMQEKKLEYIQYKLNYEEYKRKWDRKMETDAGDHLNRLQELIDYEQKSIK